MPIDYRYYPENWLTELRPAVLARAENACEHCRVTNYAVARWDTEIESYYEYGNYATCKAARKVQGELKEADIDGCVVIILTIAHLDHDITNNELTNLKALCQRCHLAHDRMDNARRKKFGKHYEIGQMKVELKFY